MLLYQFFGAFLPFAVALTYVHFCGVNIPVNDEWNFMPTIESFYGGGDWPAMVIDHYGEHRIPIPKLIILGLSRLTHYNVKTEMYLSAALMFLCAILCWYLLKQTNAAAWLFVPIGWLLLSTAQYQNLLVGWQFQIPLMNCFALLAVYLLSLRVFGVKHHVGAIGCAIAASFSFANGLMLWPAAIYLVWMRERSFRKTLLWIAAMLFALLLYAAGYSGFHRTPQDRTPQYFAAIDKSPGGVFGLFLAITGNNLGGGKLLPSIIAGCILLLIAVSLALIHRKPFTRHYSYRLLTSPWIALFIISVLSAVAVAFGRSLAWREFATSSRYLTASIFIPISLLVMASDKLEQLRHAGRQLQSTAAICLAIGLLVASYQYVKGARLGWLVGRASYYQNVKTRQCLLNYRVAPDDCLEKLYVGDARWVRDHAATLERWRLGPFHEFPSHDAKRDPLDQSPGEIEGSIDSLRVEQQPDGSIKVIVEGWSLIGHSLSPQAVVLFFDDERIDETSMLYERPDVSAFFGRAIPSSGWEFRTTVPTNRRGNHTVRIAVSTGDGILRTLAARTITF